MRSWSKKNSVCRRWPNCARFQPTKLLEAFAPPSPEAFDFGPDVDGYFLPESVPAIFAAGKQNDVPLLAGWNHDEGSFEIASVRRSQPPRA